MKNIAEMRRKHTAWSIEQNPSIITINRQQKIEKDGYFKDSHTELEPQKVRVFVSKSRTTQTITTLAGQKQIDRYYGLLADHEADIKADIHTTDEFSVDGMTFEVKSVYPQRIAGELVGYQCELERRK